MIICNSVHCQYAANNNLWIYTECIQHTFCSFYLFFWLCGKLILIIAGKVRQLLLLKITLMGIV